MPSLSEVEELALDLPEKDRALLAAHLLISLPPVLRDADDGVAEALRRDAELDADPGASISLQHLDEQIKNRRA